MPALSNLSTELILDFAQAIVFSDRAPRSFPANQFTSLLCRLTDKATNEYESARSCLERFAGGEGGETGAIFRAVDHLENCVTSLKRAFLLAERLRRDRFVFKVERHELLSGEEEGRLRRLRDAIEHTDEKIARELLEPGSYVNLFPIEDGIELGGIRIRYEELSVWIGKLHELCRRLVSRRQEDLATSE